VICGSHLYSGCFKEISGEKFTYEVIGMQLTDERHICVCVMVNSIQAILALISVNPSWC
jgi:hypothetical protein